MFVTRIPTLVFHLFFSPIFKTASEFRFKRVVRYIIMLKYSVRISIEVRLLSMMTALKGQTDFYSVPLKK